MINSFVILIYLTLSAVNGKVPVTVQFASDDAASMKFFKEQVAPLYSQSSECVSWLFAPLTSLPSDNTKMQTDCYFTCIMRDQAFSGYTREQKAAYIECMMTEDTDPIIKMDKCRHMSGIDASKLAACTMNYIQSKLMGIPTGMTLPKVAVGVKTDPAAINNLKNTICAEAKQKGVQCAFCKAP